MTVLDDLVEFARIEVESGDLEPWAEMLRVVELPDEESRYWAVKAYNAYDDLGSAWGVVSRWSGPHEWYLALDHDDAAQFPCTQERRGLRGGRVLRHLASYAEMLGGMEQARWVRQGLAGDCPEGAFLSLLRHLRVVWGVGRQTAFEWAEFLAKCCGVPVAAPDAQLWESEGPRRSLQSLYGNDSPDLAWLNDRATETRELLASRGVALSWEDLETVICDFHVMRHGRYYPGRHLAALREEIETVPEAQREPLERAWETVVPEGWRDIAPGIDKSMMGVYRDTGRLAPAVA